MRKIIENLKKQREEAKKEFAKFCLNKRCSPVNSPMLDTDPQNQNKS